MNAPATPPAVTKEDYAPTVRCFMPTANSAEMDVRCSLLLIRDCATSAKRFCCDAAWPLLDYVEASSRDTAFAAMTVKDLTETRDALRKVVSAATMIESVFAPKLPLEGANDRG